MIPVSTHSKTLIAALALLFAMAASPSVAQELVASDAVVSDEIAPDVPEISRDPSDLAPDLRPIDEDVANTALVFTNWSGRDTAILCVAFNGEGRSIGRRWIKVPSNGTKYMLASDLSEGRDFVGNAQCTGEARIHGTAVFLGAGFSDLPVANVDHRGDGRIRFPLVATY
ncbi:MAG: hypothetical protein HKP27_13270 [Myxococcales bacterium]|nr:hypothetical protein [Myxococcales bacterium]